MKPIEYERRPVKEWLESLLDGSLALPRFQRSYVWTNRKISDLILALLRGRPVGTILLIDRYTRSVSGGSSQEHRDELERFAPRPLVGTDPDLASCTELILDGQQRLTSLWRALELGRDTGLEDTERLGRHGFLKLADIAVVPLEPVDVVWPHRKKAQQFLEDPARAWAENLIPLRLLDPRHAESPLEQDPLMAWCGEVTGDALSRGVNLWSEVRRAIRDPLLARNIWFAKLPPEMDRSDAIEVFVKVNESSAVIRKFDIAVAEFDRGGRRYSLREEISRWAERNTHCENFFGPDEETMIPQVGELALKVACLQENRTPTDKHFTARDVLRRLSQDDMLKDIFGGIAWSLEFLAQERIWKDKYLPSAVPLRVLPAIWPEFRDVADSSDLEGVARRCLRAYLWRTFVTDRYKGAVATRLREDFNGLKAVLPKLQRLSNPMRTLRKNVPIFSMPVPRVETLHDLDEPLAPPTRKDALSRALLVATLQKGARDFGSGEIVSSTNIGGRQAHHLFPKAYLRASSPAVTDAKQINHCLNYALVSGPTNRKIAAKAPLEYMRDRYQHDKQLGEAELEQRVKSHLIPYGAFAICEKDSGGAYGQFLLERATLVQSAIKNLADGQPV